MAGRREGTRFIDELPDPGPWRMIVAKIGDRDLIASVSPHHPPRFYEDGKIVNIFGDE